MKKTLKFFVLISTLVIWQGAFADTVTIENDVNTSASTGGNSSSNSTQGSSKSSIKVRTFINGEVVEDYENTEQGTDASQSYKNTVADDGASSDVDTEVTVGKDFDKDVLKEIFEANLKVKTMTKDEDDLDNAEATTSTSTDQNDEEGVDEGAIGNFIKEIFKYVFSFWPF